MWLIYAHKYIHIYFRLELSPTYCMRNTCIEALYNASKFLVAMAAYSCLILSVTENFIHLHYFVKISFSSVDKTFQLNCHDVVINCTIDGRHRDKHHKKNKKQLYFLYKVLWGTVQLYFMGWTSPGLSIWTGPLKVYTSLHL